MRSFKQLTKHPETGEWEEATWIDDLFADGKYGVVFPSIENDIRDIDVNYLRHIAYGSEAIETEDKDGMIPKGTKVRLIRSGNDVSIWEKFKARVLETYENSHNIRNQFLQCGTRVVGASSESALIPANAVINTRTQEELEELGQWLKDVGYLWRGGHKPSKADRDVWRLYEEDTCIGFEDGEIVFGQRVLQEENGYQIIPFSTIKEGKQWEDESDKEETKSKDETLNKVLWDTGLFDTETGDRILEAVRRQDPSFMGYYKDIPCYRKEKEENENDEYGSKQEDHEPTMPGVWTSDDQPYKTEQEDEKQYLCTGCHETFTSSSPCECREIAIEQWEVKSVEVEKESTRYRISDRQYSILADINDSGVIDIYDNSGEPLELELLDPKEARAIARLIEAAGKLVE